jgi:hypothetical protein
MGFWGVLLELARAVVPHAAPHVARAVVARAKERRAASESASLETPNQPSNESLASAISYLEKRLAAAEEKAAAVEEQMRAQERYALDRWNKARKLFIGLMVWNAAATAALIAVLVYLVSRK